MKDPNTQKVSPGRRGPGALPYSYSQDTLLRSLGPGDHGHTDDTIRVCTPAGFLGTRLRRTGQ